MNKYDLVGYDLVVGDINAAFSRANDYQQKDNKWRREDFPASRKEYYTDSSGTRYLIVSKLEKDLPSTLFNKFKRLLSIIAIVATCALACLSKTIRDLALGKYGKEVKFIALIPPPASSGTGNNGISSQPVITNHSGNGGTPSQPVTTNNYNYEDTVKTNFQDKYGLTLDDATIKKAKSLVDFVLMNRGLNQLDDEKNSKHPEEIIKEKIEKKLGQQIGDNDNRIKEKLLSLAVKTEILFKATCVGHEVPAIVVKEKSDQSGLNYRSVLPGEGKLAPHLKLTGLTGAVLESTSRERIHLLFIEKIGGGSFNTAWKAYDYNRKGVEAYRELKDGMLQSRDVMEEWDDEVEIHRYLQSRNVPGIVKLNDVVKLDMPLQDGRIVTQKRVVLQELCDGDLEDLLKTTTKLKPKEAESLFLQLLETFSSIHRLGYVHDDLKLANVFYKKNGDGSYESRVGDFGMMGEMEGQRAGIHGTPQYQPLDAFFRGALQNDAMDNWALGLIGFSLKYGNILDRDLLEFRRRIDWLDHDMFKGLIDKIRDEAKNSGLNPEGINLVLNTLLNALNNPNPINNESRFLAQWGILGTQSHQILTQEDVNTLNAWKQFFATLSKNTNVPDLFEYIKFALNSSWSNGWWNDPYNIMIDTYLKPYYTTLLNEKIGKRLTDGDPMDETIRGLLQLDPAARWNSGLAHRFLSTQVASRNQTDQVTQVSSPASTSSGGLRVVVQNPSFPHISTKRRYQVRDYTKGNVMGLFNGDDRRNQRTQYNYNDSSGSLMQYKQDAQRLMAGIQGYRDLNNSKLKKYAKNVTLFSYSDKGQTKKQEELLGRFDVVAVPGIMTNDGAWKYLQNKNGKLHKTFFIHHGAALNIGENKNATDFEHYSEPMLDQFGRVQTARNGREMRELKEDEYINDTGIIFKHMLKAQEASEVKDAVWFPFGMGAFLRQLPENDHSGKYQNVQNMRNLRERIANQFVEQLEQSNTSMTIHLCLPVGKPGEESTENYNAFMKALQKTSPQVQQKIHLYINEDATQVAQRLADRNGEYSVSLANGANRKLIGNHWFDDRALNAIDENLHRRNPVAAAIALLLDGGVHPKQRGTQDLENRVIAFGGQVQTLK